MKPSLKKSGDFTVAEGHGHPLIWKKLTKPVSASDARILIRKENKASQTCWPCQ